MSSSVEQKKNQTSDTGASPTGAKKPDWAGFSQNLAINTVKLIAYLIVGSIGLYAVKTVVASTSDGSSCSVDLFPSNGGADNKNAFLPNCKSIEFGGASVPLGKSAQTSAIARYFHKVFRNVFTTNTFITNSYYGLLSELPNLGALLLYGLLSIPFFIVLWLCNWLSNIAYGLYNLQFLFSEPCSSNRSNCSGNWKRDVSFLSWKIIPVAIYVCFMGLTTFFCSIYTTISAIGGPLFLKFIQNKQMYSFTNFLQDVTSQYRTFWTILFSLIMTVSANSYLGTTYVVGALFASLLTLLI